MQPQLLYIEDLPFEYKRYSKKSDLPLSNKLIAQFNDYYGEIQKSDTLNEEKWTQVAADLKSAVEAEVHKSGNKKSIYVKDYVQFIFGVSYLLYDKFHLSQSKVSNILKINPNKYSKLDIFPLRSYEAFTKLNDKSKKKTLIPNNLNSEGIRIADCINKEVQAVYACHAFVGVSNDLDLFVNISTTDNKHFILTSPFEFEDDDTQSIELANYAFARYLFALGNQLFDDNDMYVPAGKIKEKIIQMLKMEDIAVFSPTEQDELIRKVLLDGDDLEEYMLVGHSYSEFQAKREKYKLAFENMNIELENLESEYRNYYEELWESDLDDIPEGEEIDYDKVAEKHYEYFKKECKRLEQELLADIRIQKLFTKLNIDFQECLEVIRKSIKSNVVVPNPTFEKKLKSAASYWISEVFADYDGSEDFYNAVLTYLEEESHLFDYFDALNAPPQGKMENASFQERKNIHIDIEDENSDISAKLGGWNIKSPKENVRPLMIYLDTDSIQVNAGDIDKLITDQRAIVIVHDKSGELRECVKVLNQDLDLYITFSEGVE